MPAIKLPARQIAELYAALDAACAHTNYNQPGRDDALWNRLNSARSFVRVYLLDDAPAVEVETIKEAA